MRRFPPKRGRFDSVRLPAIARWLGRLMVALPLIALAAGCILYLLSLGRLLSRNMAPVVVAVVEGTIQREVRVGQVIAFAQPGKLVLVNVAVSNSRTFAADQARALEEHDPTVGLPALVADRVTVHYDWRALLFDPTNAAASLGDIVVDTPTVFVERLAPGKFNFSTLFSRKANPKAKPFKGQVLIDDGTAYFLDEIAPAAVQPAINVLKNLSGLANFHSDYAIYYSVKGNGEPRHLSTVAVSGDVLRNDTPQARAHGMQGYRLRLQAGNANAPYLASYFLSGAVKAGRVTTGIADADVTISQIGKPHHAPLDVTGAVNVARTTVLVANRRLVARPIAGVTGRFFFTGNGATVDASGAVDNMPISVSGAVFDLHHPHLALLLSAPRVQVAGLRDAFPFVPALPAGVGATGSGGLNLSVSGTAQQPIFQGEAHLGYAVIAGNRLVNLTGQATYANGLLTVKTVTGQALAGGGTVEVHGVVDTRAKPATYLFSGTGKDVNLAAIRLPQAFTKVGPFAGVGDASFLATNRSRGGEAGPPTVAADFSILRAGIRHVQLAQVSGRATWQAGKSVSLQDFFVREPNGGMLLANGTVPLGSWASSRWNLAVSAARVQLADLMTPFGVTQIGGVAYFRGNVVGARTAPKVTGRATVFSPHYGQFEADTLEADLTATQTGVQIVRGVINRFPATGSVTGTVSDLGPNPMLALKVSIAHQELADVVQMATQIRRAPRAAAGQRAGGTASSKFRKAVAQTLPSITGEASGTFSISGRIHSLRVEGSAKVANATIGAYQVASAQADVGFSGGVLNVANAEVRAEGAQLTGSGAYQVGSGRVSAQFRSDGIDLARAMKAVAPTLTITGTLNAAGAVAGSVKAPIVTVSANADNLVVEGVPFDQTQVTARYANGVVTNGGSPIVLVSEGATYRVSSLRYNTSAKEIAVTGSVQGETLEHLRSIVQNPALQSSPAVLQMRAAIANLPPPVSGTFDITSFSVSGPLSDLSGQLTASAADLEIGDIRLNSVESDLAYARHTLTIGRFVARGETAYVEASGTIDPQGAIDARLDASNIDLAEFDPFLPRGTKLAGQISDLTVEATGQTRSPDLVGSLTLDHPAYNSFTVDRLDSGQVTLANGKVTIDRLSLTKNEALPGGQNVDHVAWLSGSFPFAWVQGGFLQGGIPADGPLALHAEVPQQSLSVLTLFMPSESAKDFGGNIQGHVDLGGTIAHKSITGSLLLTDGALSVPALHTGLIKVNANVTFAGSTATVEQLTAQSTAGGSISVTGTAALGAVHVADTTRLADALLGGIVLDLNAKANDFTIDEPRVAALYNAGFHGRMNGSLRVTDALLTPKITGGVNVADAVGSLPTAQAPAGPAPTYLVDPSFDINVAVAKGSSLRSAQLNAQGDGTMHILGSLSSPDVTGHFTIRGGRFAFPTAVFTIQPVGTVDLTYNPPDEVSQLVYVRATTSIDITQATLTSNLPATGVEMPASYAASQYNPLGSLGPSGGNYQITVTIQGDLAQPNHLSLDFQSNPPGLSSQQILAALGGQQAINNLAGGNVQLALQQEAAQIFTSYAVPTLLSPVETGIAQTFGLENFSINYSPLSPVQISLIKKVGPREDVTYTQLVSSRQPGAVASTLRPPEYQLKLEYNFTDRLGLYASTDDQHDNILGVEGVFNFP